MVNLREIRTAAGYSQQSLADKVYVTRQQISHIENGKTYPSVQTAMLIGQELGFPWTEFYEDEKKII